MKPARVVLFMHNVITHSQFDLQVHIEQHTNVDEL